MSKYEPDLIDRSPVSPRSDSATSKSASSENNSGQGVPSAHPPALSAFIRVHPWPFSFSGVAAGRQPRLSFRRCAQRPNRNSSFFPPLDPPGISKKLCTICTKVHKAFALERIKTRNFRRTYGFVQFSCTVLHKSRPFQSDIAPSCLTAKAKRSAHSTGLDSSRSFSQATHLGPSLSVFIRCARTSLADLVS